MTGDPLPLASGDDRETSFAGGIAEDPQLDDLPWQRLHPGTILDDALQRLAEMDEHLAQIVELRFFAGLSAQEAAEVLGVSVRKLQYDWRMARAWLKQAME